MNEEQPKKIKTWRKVLAVILLLYPLYYIYSRGLIIIENIDNILFSIAAFINLTPVIQLIIAALKGAKRGMQVSVMLFLMYIPITIWFFSQLGLSYWMIWVFIPLVFSFASALIFGLFYAFGSGSQSRVKETGVSVGTPSQSLSQVLLKAIQEGSTRSFFRIVVMFTVIAVATLVFLSDKDLLFFVILFSTIVLLNLSEMSFLISQKFTGWANGMLKVFGLTLLLLSFIIYIQIMYSYADYVFIVFIIFAYWHVLTHVFVKFVDVYKKQ